MNEWGIPDWRFAENYPDTTAWHEGHWYWEFIRRRSDIRAEFDAKCDERLRRHLAFYEICPEASPDGPWRSPAEPGFNVHSDIIDDKIPNPRLGADVQPYHAMPCCSQDGVVTFQADPRPQGQFRRIDFDLDRPLGPQLQFAKRHLGGLQEQRHGKRLQKRHHPEKWLTYLRVLDARESMASWKNICDQITEVGSIDAARQCFRAAQDLQFNF